MRETYALARLRIHAQARLSIDARQCKYAPKSDVLAYSRAIHASFCSSLLVGHWYGDVPISFYVLVHVENLVKEMALCKFQKWNCENFVELNEDRTRGPSF